MATTDAASLPLPTSRREENRLVFLVCLAHFISHFHIMLLAPLFPMIRADLGLSYTALGLTLTLFNGVGAVLQTPAGFLCDRLGARVLLIGALLISGAAYAVIGLVPHYWVLLLMFTVAGVANAVYHPADYAALSHAVAPARIGYVYSFHNFAGIAGSAVSPPALLLMEAWFGWRGAFIGAGLIGFIAAAALALYREPPSNPAAAARAPKGQPPLSGWSLLLSLPILRNFAFYVMLTIINTALTMYLIVGLNSLHGTPPATANLALTVSLVVNGGAVLFGGWIAGRSARHAAVAVAGLVGMALMLVAVTIYDLPSALMIGVLSVAGFCSGVMMPARDMIVRSVTPPGQFGKVFGFVTTGLNVGGMLAPLLFGALLDYGAPAGVFLAAAICCVLAIATVVTIPPRKAAAPE